MDKTQNSVKSYLSYLRDISRKIVSNTGFDRAYLSKQSKDFNLIADVLNSKKIPENDLLKFIRKNEKEPSNRLFVGFGLVIGGINNKIVAGPLAYVECEVWGDEKDDLNIFGENYKLLDSETYLQYQPIHQTLILNNDLLSMIISANHPITEDDEESEGDLDFLLSLKLIGFFEDKISKLAKHELSINDVINKVDGEVLNLISNSKYFNIITPMKTSGDETVDYLKNGTCSKETITKLGSIKYYKTALTFIAKVPDQLSTYEVLNSFIDTISSDSKGFKNETLLYILAKALGMQTKKLPTVSFVDVCGKNSCPYSVPQHKSNLSPEQIVVTKKLSNYIPNNLSSEQIRAIDIAWNSSISYIQGPPGTGKSFTIYNIALTAHLLKKSVLIVSQKSPALHILPQFVKSQFDRDFVIDNLLKIYDYNIKMELRESLESTLNSISSNVYNTQEISKLEKQLISLESSLVDSISYLTKYESSYRVALDLEQKAKASHDSYIVFRDELVNNFGFNLYGFDPSEKKFKTSSIHEALVFSKEMVTAGVNFRTKLRLLKIQGFFQQFNPSFKLNLTNIDLIVGTYYEMCNNYANYMQYKDALVRSSEIIGNQIENTKKSNLKLQTKYLALRIEINLRKKLSDSGVNTIQNVVKLLRYKKRSRIDSVISRIDYASLLQIYPVWVSEIRNCNLFFPVTSGMFDLVIIDEASQVNLAEIIPVLYRGKRVCIVGDHKQLSLNSTGLTFHLSKSYDALSWGKHFNNKADISFSDASERSLTVMKSSILDFIRSKINMINPPEVMLNEHYRSHPILAKFTSDMFYTDSKSKNGLKIMTAAYERYLDSAFHVIKTQGMRNSDKVIKEESDIIISYLRKIVTKQGIGFLPKKIAGKKDLTIGVICLMRNQCEYIKMAIYDEPEIFDKWDKFDMMVGTAEEFQGNERDIMFLSFSVNSGNRQSRNFYNNKNRFNVATSRARLFTIAIYSGIPSNFLIVQKYFRHFLGAEFSDFKDGEILSIEYDSLRNSCLWCLDENKYESEFEREVYHYLKEYVELRKNNTVIFNQVETCGQKRLDFVLVNKSNNKCAAVEVDGAYHFLANKTGFIYSYEHEDRIGTLRRAGWKIVNTPFYRWYNHGWLSDSNHRLFQNEISRIYTELDNYLL